MTFVAGLYDVYLLNTQLKGEKNKVKLDLNLTAKD
jgi:hypothetical protein